MTDYRELGRQIAGEMSPRVGEAITHSTGFASELRELAIDMAFGQVWSRPGLSRRDRSLVTLGILIALRADRELEYHFPIALRNGLTVEELEEVVYQAAVYAGFPSAHVAQLAGSTALATSDPES
jgi:4-carboxymuconolactone decarboxylase